MSPISKTSVASFIKTGALLLAILFFQTECVKKQETEQGKTKVIQKAKQPAQARLLSEELEKKAAELAQLRKETEALLSSLKEKEQNLNKRETRLDSLRNDLQAREEMLANEIQNFQNLRSATVIMLVAALVLLAIAIVLLVKARASGKKRVGDTEPEQLNVNEENPVQSKETGLDSMSGEESSPATKADEKAMEEEASELIADIIDGGEKVTESKKGEKEQEEKSGRKRASKSTTSRTKKTTTTRRKTPAKPKSQSGTQKEKKS